MLFRLEKSMLKQKQPSFTLIKKKVKIYNERKKHESGIDYETLFNKILRNFMFSYNEMKIIIKNNNNAIKINFFEWAVQGLIKRCANSFVESSM